MNLKKINISKGFYLFLLLIIFGVIPLSIFSVFLYSRKIMKIVYNTNAQYISELSNKDCYNIEIDIQSKYFALNEISKRMTIQNVSTKEELENFIELEKKVNSFAELFLISETGQVLDFNKYPQSLLNIAKLNFYKNPSFTSKVILDEPPFDQNNYVIIGTSIEPITIENVNYVNLCSLHNLSPISEVKHSDFPDIIYKFICQENGTIVFSENNKIHDNFFDILNTANIKDISLNEIQNAIINKESINFNCKLNEENLFVLVQPIKKTNLFLAACSPISTVKAKGNEIIKVTITLTILLEILVITFLFVMLFAVNNVNMIKSESKAKAEFLSTMSHEIRTPLNGIIGLIHLMQSNMHDPERLDYYFKKTTKTSNYLLQLINNILDISKFENGKIQLANNPFFINDMIESVVSIHRDNMTAKGIKFEVSQNVFCSAIFGDEIRIQQIIMNLIGNAYKFTEKDGTITFSIYQENTFETDEISTIFTVTDTGCGISKDFQKQIFEAFSQERNKSKESQKGTGLGLAISYMLAKQMHGKLEVESEVNKGSKFIFSLPAKIASPKEVKDYIMECSAVNSEKEHNILIAEDNELNAEILDEIFTEENIKHKIVTDGKQVIDVFAESAIDEYDVILMDIQMPYYDGYEATQIIRKMKRPDAKSIKIIACSANTFEEDKETARKTGMNGFIVKPINVSNLMEILGN